MRKKTEEKEEEEEAIDYRFYQLSIFKKRF